MYAEPFTKVLGMVGCQITSKTLGIRPSESNCKYYKHVQRGQISHLQSDSYDNQYILYGAEKMQKIHHGDKMCLQLDRHDGLHVYL